MIKQTFIDHLTRTILAGSSLRQEWRESPNLILMKMTSCEISFKHSYVVFIVSIIVHHAL